VNHDTAIVIVNYRTPEMTLANVAALAGERAKIADLRVVVVDGGSSDGSAEALRTGLAKYAWCELLPLTINGGFGWANNQAILHLLQGAAPPAFIHLLNPDAVITPDAVVALRDAMIANPTCAAAGSQLLNGDGSKAGCAFRFPSVAREFFRGAQMNRVGQAFGLSDGIMRPDAPAEVEWVTGASVMLRAAALKQIGLFDTGFFLYFEEVELMHRLTRGGWTVRFVPDSRVLHVGGAATGMADAELHERSSIPDYMFASRRRFFTRVYGPAGARNATLAWLAGNLMLRMVRLFGILKERPSAHAERSGMRRHGINANAFDKAPAVTHWNDLPGQLPAWQQAQ
jgi:N-acetylglucosaminyl-diphospho-decaprenol L-rhamnosyltransferase